MRKMHFLSIQFYTISTLPSVIFLLIITFSWSNWAVILTVGSACKLIQGSLGGEHYCISSSSGWEQPWQADFQGRAKWKGASGAGLQTWFPVMQCAFLSKNSVVRSAPTDNGRWSHAVLYISDYGLYLRLPQEGCSHSVTEDQKSHFLHLVINIDTVVIPMEGVLHGCDCTIWSIYITTDHFRGVLAFFKHTVYMFRCSSLLQVTLILVIHDAWWIHCDVLSHTLLFKWNIWF